MVSAPEPVLTLTLVGLTVSALMVRSPVAVPALTSALRLFTVMLAAPTRVTLLLSNVLLASIVTVSPASTPLTVTLPVDVPVMKNASPAAESVAVVALSVLVLVAFNVAARAVTL